MACRLVGAKPFSEPMLKLYYHEQISLNIIRNSYIFIHENAFENVVCEMVVILPQRQNVNSHEINRYRWYKVVGDGGEDLEDMS